MSLHKMTVSSQLKSANTQADIDFHSGLKNRAKMNHENENIDTKKTNYNKVIIPEDVTKEGLLEQHYGEKVKNHNENQRGKKDYWDGVQGYLDTFEGKTVGSSKNERWATASQISYFGNQDSINDLFDELEGAGISEQQIREAYTRGYEEYVLKHNEKFKTLQITRSDIHFDEATPHGHDEIVKTGHTEKGNASDSLNNAVSEHYNSYGSIKADKDKDIEAVNNFTRLRQYRSENDSIMYNSIHVHLKELATEHGLNVEFEPLRTSEVNNAQNSREYKVSKDFEKWGEDLLEQESKLAEKDKALEKISEQNKIDSEKNKKEKQDLEREKEELMTRESEITESEERVNGATDEILEKNNVLEAEKEKVDNLEADLINVFAMFTYHSTNEKHHDIRNEVIENGFINIDENTFDKALMGALDDIIEYEQKDILHDNIHEYYNDNEPEM